MIIPFDDIILSEFIFEIPGVLVFLIESISLLHALERDPSSFEADWSVFIVLFDDLRIMSEQVKQLLVVLEDIVCGSFREFLIAFPEFSF